jgi:hypothetical protein
VNLGKIAWHSFTLIICSTGAVIAAIDLAEALTVKESKEWVQATNEEVQES